MKKALQKDIEARVERMGIQHRTPRYHKFIMQVKAINKKRVKKYLNIFRYFNFPKIYILLYFINAIYKFRNLFSILIEI